MEKSIRGPIALAFILIALLICLYAVAGFYAVGGQPHAPAAGSTTSAVPSRPAPTASDVVTVRDANPFQMVVSYTNRGFEPVSAHITKGQTVRFTNNSSEQLWVAAAGAALYPGVENGCGSSALDSCKALAPGEFWQFTFAKSGTWKFANNLDKANEGTMIVQ